jgi:NAD(P)H-hydrate epimerase
MSGAAYLCGKAAYRAGTGLVKILTSEENRIILQASLPEALLEVYNAKSPSERDIENATKWADVIAVGPGLGCSKGAHAVLSTVLRNSASPLVIDADALNIISKDPALWDLVPKGSVITPHPGEMSRLCGCPIDDILANVNDICIGFANAHGIVCVLKDHATAVSDGKELYVNDTGNSGMATAGSGDVLTGIIAALMAQGMTPFAAAVLGVRIHGLAGDHAAQLLGEYSMMASDMIDSIPHVIKQ